MPKNNLVTCEHFDRKVRILYEFGSTQPRDSNFRVDSNRALAKYLSVPASRITTMRAGDERPTKIREPGKVEPRDLESLGRLYAQLSAQEIHLDEAIVLWRDGHYENFRERLRSIGVGSLFGLIRGVAEELEIGVYLDANERHMLDLGRPKTDADLVVKRGQPFYLTVRSEPGRSLICISETGDARQLIVPNKKCCGKVAASEVRLPSEGGWSVNDGSEWHRLVVVELPFPEPPKFEAGPFDTAKDSHLSTLLEHMPYAEDWRWGEVSVYCEPAMPRNG